jgi:hypothetical protein
MSDNNLSEIVGDDVNLASAAPETPEAPQEQAAPEAPETPEAPEEASAKPPSVVPLAALHEERARRKELAASIEQMRTEQARRDAILEQRFAKLAELREQAQMPSFEENPAEHLRHGQQQLQQTVQQIAEANRVQNEQRQQMAYVQQLAGVVQQRVAQFAQAAPDYFDAVSFLQKQRAAELEADGADPSIAEQQAQRELDALALDRTQRGQNPAEVAYKLAKARGFTPKPAQPQQPSAAEKLQTQQKGVAASRTLGSGGAAQNKLSLEALASMSDDDFAEATKGNNWQKLFGG